MQRQSLAGNARVLRWIATAALAVLFSALLIYRLGIDLGDRVIVQGRSHTAGYDLTAAAADVGALFFAIALVQLIRLLGRVERGDLFTTAVTRAFRSFAFWLMLAAIAAIMLPPLAGLLSSAGGAVRRVEIRIDLRDIMFVVAGLVMFLVARMLDEAARIEIELEEIV